MNFEKNNLDISVSPYLLQHKDNPIHWQEWTPAVLEHAKSSGKPILVSIGYATCHWCHVMASEAFSNDEVAEFLNSKFVCIKVDREQRPDIDQYFMNFIQMTTGQGGWPLNVICDSTADPVQAFTYAPVTPKMGMIGIVPMLKQVLENLDGPKPAFESKMPQQQAMPGDKLNQMVKEYFDYENYGWGQGQKFPPSTVLVYLLKACVHDDTLKSMIEKTLDIMAERGLHDHLQGGFYRYTVDSQWTIPHFEKMLYDQAGLLMAYSLAYKVFGKESYKEIAQRIVVCLKETFLLDSLLVSAHDADTEHVEGATYVWTEEKLRDVLGDAFTTFESLYELSPNFEGKIHLVKVDNDFQPEIEKKLLAERNNRVQPFRDDKIITSWNCLAGIGLVYASRYIDSNYFTLATEIFDALVAKHWDGSTLVHSSLGDKKQSEEFLEDYASLLLFCTYLEEEGYTTKIMSDIKAKVDSFKEDGWVESSNSDFRKIMASEYDHPSPSSISLAELGRLRYKILSGEEYSSIEYKNPLHAAFFNLAPFTTEGKMHIIHTPEKISWDKLPVNSIQVNGNLQDCYKGTCQEFKTTEDLLSNL